LAYHSAFVCSGIRSSRNFELYPWRWKDYLWPLIVINNQQNYTLQLSLANLVGTNTVEWGTLLAYATLAMIPVLMVFLCFQRYFVKGSLSGGVKG
jgi:alpha-1,4-digalacturonate transport system permease protein